MSEYQTLLARGYSHEEIRNHLQPQLEQAGFTAQEISDYFNKEGAASAVPQNVPNKALPIIVFFLLLFCLGGALFTLWKKHAASQEAPLASPAVPNKELEALRQQKTRLEDLLRQDPCTLRQSLGLPGRSAPARSGADAHTPSTPASGGEAATAPLQPPATTSSPDAAAAKNTSVDRVENATVFIISEVKGGLSTGTGFFVAPDMVMSNAHVVGNAPSRIFIINRKLGVPVQAKVVSIRGGKNTGERDYALLRVPKQNSIQPLALRDTPRRTEKVNAWGFPHAVSRSDPKYQALMKGQKAVAPELVFSDGVVSAIIERTPPIIAHTAPLSQGNSGGPLTDENGLVVGINTLISLDDESYRQTSMALPAADFINFLQQNGVAVTLVKP